MFDVAHGAAVHTGNFVRAFRQLPAAAALGLRENPNPTPDILEGFTRFVLTHIDSETVWLLLSVSGFANSAVFKIGSCYIYK